MHFFTFTTLALSSSFIAPSFTAPTSDINPLVERQTPADAPAALAIVRQLYVDVKQYTAVINSTAAALSKESSPTDEVKAGRTFTAAIASINALVVDTTASVKSLPSSATKKRALEPSSAEEDALAKRQLNPADPTGLATAVTLILLEVGGALNNIIAVLGLGATLSFLGPLVASLSLLLASLIPVVNDLLALVGALLSGVLGGLSLALAGLVL
ncbi:MAG: hypothetical protein LQ344_002894 [Seirophora lacunosa]|nr:MAG: hypothetical protein LQ344_002894 [Seirophora lacunosa]